MTLINNFERNAIKNILISNIYSWDNKGDAAIVIAMLEDIKSQFPDANLCLSTIDSNDFGKYGRHDYTENIANLVYNNIFSRYAKIPILLFFLIRLNIFSICLRLFGLNAYFLFGKKIQQKIKLYQKMDLIIACGGGYMLTTDNLSIVNKYMFWHDYYIGWKLFKNNYLLYNQSVGPFFNRFHLFLVTPLLKNARKILCREELSLERLKKYNLGNCSLASDIAFTLGTEECSILVEGYQYDKARNNIGITVRQWLGKEAQGYYESSIAQFIETLINTDPNYRFYFMPQVIYNVGNDDDMKTAMRVFDKLSDTAKSKTNLVRENLNPMELKNIISKMDCFIGTRMHSNIFALTSGIKTIAIAYEPKTTGIMQLLGLKKYVIDMERVSGENLIQLYSTLKSDTEYYSLLKTNLNKVRKRAFTDLKENIL